jgi:hypothetical protein
MSLAANIISTPSPANGHTTLQSLPVEVRYILFELLLPRHQQIELRGPNDRSPALAKLAGTCKQFDEELKEWYENPRIRERFIKTLSWGLVDKDTAEFHWDIATTWSGYHNPQGTYIAFWSRRDNPPATLSVEAAIIQHMAIKMERFDGGYLGPLGWIWRLPQLKGLDMWFGNDAEYTPTSREDFAKLPRNMVYNMGGGSGIEDGRHQLDTTREIWFKGLSMPDAVVRLRGNAIGTSDEAVLEQEHRNMLLPFLGGRYAGF